MEKIPRRWAMDEQTFIDEFICGNHPVVITDAMVGWPARQTWNAAYFNRRFGEREVQIYDALFTLVDVDTLGSYLARNFGQGSDFVATEYVRAYAKFKDLDIVWADEIFSDLASDWSHPYFFPQDSFALPTCGPDASISPVSDAFPYKGLFVSGRGARTRLHRDPYGTDAMLCQFHGEKRLLIYCPDDADKLVSDGEFVDPHDVDARKFPHFGTLKPAFDDVLVPGEVLFIPGGWFHDVTTLFDSISITWNFAHSASAGRFDREVANAANTLDRDMLIYLTG